MEKLDKQPCPMCGKKTLTLIESEDNIPYFGKVYLFSMNCSNCKYKKADIEAAEKKEPCRYTLEVNSEKDMKIKIVKSSAATVKLPHVMTIEPGSASQGYITNVEGLLNRVKDAIQIAINSEEDKDAVKKARRLMKKVNRVIWGSEKLKIIIEDPSGNSAIISDKAVKSKLK